MPGKDRWIRERGIRKIIPKLFWDCSNNYNLEMKDFAKIIIPCPMTAWIKGLGKTLERQTNRLKITFRSP